MIHSIKQNLQNYKTHFPEESNLLEHLSDQILAGDDVVSRTNFNGHVTASALILNNKNEVLVLWHNKLQKFLQPGGHLELGDNNLVESSMREMKEESGITNAILNSWCSTHDCPIMIDTHYIPENSKKGEPEHFHHDFMYIYSTDSDEVVLDINEVSSFKWIPISEVRNEDSLVGRALLKMQQYNIQV